MALLEAMPPITIPTSGLAAWGVKWRVASSFTKKEGMDFGGIFDASVGNALSVMLGGTAIITPNAKALLPTGPDVVEVGPFRVIGGIRPQNYDVGYRPDGVRFAFDSKTLNDTKSVGKNFQNMVNDLATEATTVHMRFPYAVVGFMVVIPTQCLSGPIRDRSTQMLKRLYGRRSPIDEAHKAEALSLVLWNPADGTIDPSWPEEGSPLRIEAFSAQVQTQYSERYNGMAPHDKPSPTQRALLLAQGVVIPEDDQQEATGETA
jgi:hypothetical protein